MKEYQYNQLICCSSQKSLTSGYPGFGVRAKSPGLSNAEADGLYTGSGLRYALPVSEMATPELLRSTPQLDTIYPHQYTVRAVQTSSGATKHLVARVMYAGADYGFFDESGFNNRVGSNYIVHIAVFDQEPPVKVVAAMLTQGKFMPADTLCSFDNPEFKRMLTGEPFEMPMGSITVDDDEESLDAPVDAGLMVALLQAYKNRQSNNEICKVIYKTDTALVEDTIRSLGRISPRLTQGLKFNANVSGQGSIPLELDMIIVNDKDTTETMDDYYITVDHRRGANITRNIEQNYLFDRLRDALTLQNLKEADMIAELYMQLCNKPDANMEQAYRIMVMANSEETPDIGDVKALDLELVAATRFPLAELERLWANVNGALDQALAYPLSTVKVKTALDVIRELNSLAPSRLSGVGEYGKMLKQVLFHNPELFAKILEDNSERIDTVIGILNASPIEAPTEQELFTVLSTTQNLRVWNQWLTYYYGSQRGVDQHMAAIVNAIMTYGTRQTRGLAIKLFPIERYCKQWVELIDKHPDYMIVARQSLDSVLTAGLKDSPKETLATILRLSPDVQAQMSPEVRDAVDIHNGIELKRPDLNTLNLAVALGVKSEYIQEMFAKWVKSGVSPDQIAAFVTRQSTRSGKTAALLDIIWKQTHEDERKATLLRVVDNVKLSGYSMKDVIALMESKDAREILGKESGFMKKMFRKFMGTKILLLCVMLTAMLGSCDKASLPDPSTHSPFQAQYFGDTIGTNEVIIREYDTHGNFYASDYRRYSPSGQLLKRCLYNENTGGFDTIEYVYDKNEKLVDILAPNETSSDFNYDDRNRLVSYTTTRTVKRKKKKPVETSEFVQINYNNDNSVQSIEVSDGSSQLSEAVYYYRDNGRVDYINITTPDTKQEIDFDNKTGMLYRNFKLTNPGGKPKETRKYYFRLTQQDGDSLHTFQADLTNSKGHARGSAQMIRSLYTGTHLAAAKEEVVNEKISAIPAPVHSSNFFVNYMNDLKYRIAANQAKTKSPTGWLLVFLLLLTGGFAWWYFYLAAEHDWFQPFAGKVQPNGMRRLWMFNKEPYIDVALAMLIVLAAFVSAVLTMMVIGGVTYGLLWVIKVLLIILIWVGWIALILGILALWGGEGGGCLMIIVGGLIVAFSDTFRRWGNDMVDWGFGFMKKLNIFEWGLNLFTDFWDVILIAFASPLVLFMGFAAAIIVLVCLLWGFEWLVMKAYGISRPCPVCGSKGDKEFWSDRIHKHPVKLHPGVYGVFSHREPSTGKKMPTMLMNGKGKLLRRCTSCGNFISSDMEQSYGTEKHIGFVGNRSSGKSYLTYTLLNGILTQYGSSAHQTDVDQDTNISANATRVRNDAGIQTDLRDQYRAIQVILQQKLRPLPYHLFFYDVAGEKFNQKSTASKTAMDFYRNVEQIVFIIDPTTMDFSRSACGPKMEEWLKKHGSPEKFSTEGVFSTMNAILESVGRKSKSIDFIFAVVKADLGYLEHCGYGMDMTEQQIEGFMREELNLYNVINVAKGSFSKVEFVTTSAMPKYSASVARLTEKLLRNAGIK